jgi:hypothetical protein
MPGESAEIARFLGGYRGRARGGREETRATADFSAVWIEAGGESEGRAKESVTQLLESRTPIALKTVSGLLRSSIGGALCQASP